jgi:hypothetical protein
MKVTDIIHHGDNIHDTDYKLVLTEILVKVYIYFFKLRSVKDLNKNLVRNGWLL